MPEHNYTAVYKIYKFLSLFNIVCSKRLQMPTWTKAKFPNTWMAKRLFPFLISKYYKSNIFLKPDLAYKMEHFKLLIIGAGASGIAAATKLLENGFTDFLIIEAENRIGGRIYSTTIGDIPIELGAEWIHGENDNIVFELASKYDLADTDSLAITSFIYTKFYDTHGFQINRDISSALTKGCYEILQTIGENLSSDVLKSSLGNYFETEYYKLVDNLNKTLNIDTELSKKFLKTFENWENSIDGSHSWYETSMNDHLEYWECSGNSLIKWKSNHYSTLFNLLTKKIPNNNEQLPVDGKITFNKEIVKVHWNYNCESNIPNVKVECLDGTLYSADRLLITCSLGVLKEKATEMFAPSLPEEKLNSINNLGFGTVDKIFVKFGSSWWKDDCDGFGFLWSENERKNDTSGWLNGIICFHPINEKWPVLRGWVTAEAAQVMESLSAEGIMEGLNHLFNKFLGPTIDVPLIESCVTSKWHTNPHFRGSYSCRFMKSETTNAWASHLAKSVCNVKGQPILFFGGEATHDHYFSTVHGAVEAGQREAKKIMENILARPQLSEYYQVAIIGAGISGLAAAKTLLDNGISDIIVLEAQLEPGGRIRTCQVEGDCLELGAQWIHGDKNEVFTICQENNLLTNEYSSEGEGLYLRENGERIPEDLIKEIDDVVKDILENCENYVLSNEHIPQSIGEELLLKFNEYLESCKEDSQEIKIIKRELFGWHIRYQLIDNSCSDLCNLSAKAWGHFKFCGGNDYVNFKNGYISLINTMVNSLPDNVIHYESPVERIEWAEEVNIFDEDISNAQKNFNTKITISNGAILYAQFVIVTCSLGYLKRKYKTMFYPFLPKYLSDAIEFLDFGVIDKIFLIYEKPWWDLNTKGFQLVWSDEVSEESTQQWKRYLTGFDVILKDKPILLGWVGGEGAKIVEQMTEEEVGRQATEILRQFTKNNEIPFPKKVIRTKWWCNEYVRGAYSHITVKCDEPEISCSNLAQPVFSTIRTETETYKRPTLLLAGESTHKNHFSTVHGAYESGQAQARVILEHLQSINQ